MSRTDLFAKYTQIYAKAQAKEIVPAGTFVRQLIDVPRRSYDVGVFFKAKRASRIVQVHLGNPIPKEVATQEGFLETEDSTYLSRTILSKFKTVDFLRVVISAGEILTKKEQRVEFLKTGQRILDVILRKSRNILHLGELEPFQFDRKVRTVLRGITVLMKSLPMLNPFKYGLFSWQLFSHKLCRWLVPFAMLMLFFSNGFLFLDSTLYLYIFILQCAFYTIAFGGVWSNFFFQKDIIKIASFFILVNLSILNAWFKYFRGERMIKWDPSER